MVFHSESIDFVKTYQNIKRKFNPSTSVCRKSFGAPIVRMADSVITTYFDMASVKGVKKCLEYEISQAHWRDYLWVVPLSKHRLFYSPYSQDERQTISLLADSIMLSIIAYRVQLNETHTGLAHIVFNEVIQGFEWVCDWIRRGVQIQPSANELVATFDIDHLMEFISDR